MNNYYKENYIPQIVKTGKLTCWIGSLLVFVPALIVTFFYGAIPGKGPLTVAIIA